MKSFLSYGALAHFETGRSRKWWVRECFEGKIEEISEFAVAPHPAIWTKKLSKFFHAK